MAGGGQGANAPQSGQSPQAAPAPASPPMLQGGVKLPTPEVLSPQQIQAFLASQQAVSQPVAPLQGGVGGVTRPMMLPQQPMQGYADGGFVNPSFMQYQGQGQLNQPQVSAAQTSAGPDGGGDYAPANMGFDNSGSDGGVGGQPTQMQTPLSGNSPTANVMAQGNKPLGIAQFQQPQGLQIAGNPTSQIVQRPQIR